MADEAPVVAEGAGLRRRSLPGSLSLRSIASWVLLMGVLGALDGWVGLGLGVAIAAVLVAGFPGRALAIAGVGAWLSVPVIVLVHGLPSHATFSPEFATHNLLAAHVAFSGLALLVVAAVVSHPAQHRPRGNDVDDRQPLGDVPDAARWVLIGVVAVAAIVVSAVVATV